jgi:hypothetical protein
MDAAYALPAGTIETCAWWHPGGSMICADSDPSRRKTVSKEEAEVEPFTFLGVLGGWTIKRAIRHFRFLTVQSTVE